MKNILAVDTSTQVLYISLKVGNRLYSKTSDDKTKHSSKVLPLIDEMLKEANIKAKDLDLLLSTKGPGSFTGLRIAMSTLKGLSVALNIPYCSINSLDLFSSPYSQENKTIISTIDAAKKRIYCAVYKNGTKLSDNLDLDRTNFKELLDLYKDTILCGPYAKTLGEEFNCVYLDTISHSDLLINIGVDYYNRNGNDLVGEGPLYVRESDAQIALMKKTNLEIKASNKPIYMDE